MEYAPVHEFRKAGQRARPVHAMASRGVSPKGRRESAGPAEPSVILALTPCQCRRAAICIPVRTSTVVRPRVLLFGEPRSSTVRPVGGRTKRLVCASSGELTTDTVRARCTPGVSFQAHYAFPRAQAPLEPHLFEPVTPRQGNSALSMCALGSLNADYSRARTTRRRTGVPLAYYATVEARGLAQKACICRRACRKT